MHAIQLEWSLVEQPALPRFRNFPLVDADEPAAQLATRPSPARRSLKAIATAA
ncbi:MAG TPA: hypothetical protein VHD62_13020 [Opitutaceae bacterium]|nr:hypothetical protein [Opitutaceae bacterium]